MFKSVLSGCLVALGAAIVYESKMVTKSYIMDHVGKVLKEVESATLYNELCNAFEKLGLSENDIINPEIANAMSLHQSLQYLAIINKLYKLAFSLGLSGKLALAFVAASFFYLVVAKKPAAFFMLLSSILNALSFDSTDSIKGYLEDVSDILTN